jgi:hypothetical protein
MWVIFLLILIPVYTSAEQQIPSWIKNTAKWWSQGAVKDGEFVKGIQYIVANGIVNISNSSSAQEISSKGTTTVTCTATDVASNSAVKTFHITVVSP